MDELTLKQMALAIIVLLLGPLLAMFGLYAMIGAEEMREIMKSDEWVIIAGFICLTIVGGSLGVAAVIFQYEDR
jgi:hypothetical protein